MTEGIAGAFGVSEDLKAKKQQEAYDKEFLGAVKLMADDPEMAGMFPKGFDPYKVGVQGTKQALAMMQVGQQMKGYGRAAREAQMAMREGEALRLGTLAWDEMSQPDRDRLMQAGWDEGLMPDEVRNRHQRLSADRKYVLYGGSDARVLEMMRGEPAEGQWQPSGAMVEVGGEQVPMLLTSPKSAVPLDVEKIRGKPEKPAPSYRGDLISVDDGTGKKVQMYWAGNGYRPVSETRDVVGALLSQNRRAPEEEPSGAGILERLEGWIRRRRGATNETAGAETDNPLGL
jgi:hypothetical protein